MRVLIKLFGYTFLGLLMLICGLQFVSTNTRTDEMETAATIAMSQTQTVMAEQIEDRKFNTNIAREHWTSEDEYFQYFVDSYKIQLSTDSKCNIDLLNASLDKGLLDVRVTCSYKRLDGKVATISTAKTGIVEVKENYEN